MIPETNRLLLVLRQWEADGLTLSVEGDKIRTSRALTDAERELITEIKSELLAIIPTMSFLSKANCIPFLRESYQNEVRRAGERIKEKEVGNDG